MSLLQRHGKKWGQTLEREFQLRVMKVETIEGV